MHGKEEYDFDDEESLDGDGVLGKDEEAGGQGVRGGERERRKKKGHVRWTSSVVGMGVFKGRGEEGKVRLEEEGERGWGRDARDGRKAEVSVRVAAGDDGFRGI